MNPFHYGKIVYGDDFCPRVEEQKLKEAFESGKIILINGKPKVGKTSLVKQVLRNFGSYSLIHVDLKLIETLADVEKKIVLSLIESEVKTTPFKEVLVKYQKFSPSIKVDSSTDDISFSVPTRAGVTSESIIDLLKNFMKESNGKTPILFLDNIQGIMSLEDKEFLPVLMEYISQTRKIRYVIVESKDLFDEKRTVIAEFANENVESIYLGPIPLGDYQNYMQARFSNAGCSVKEDVLVKFEAISGSLTGDRQHLAYSLFEVRGEANNLDVVHLSKALHNIFDKHKEFFDVIFEELTPLQRKVLKIMSSSMDSKIYSRPFVEQVGPVASNTIIKVVQALVKRRIVYKEGPYYRFSNPFFREWINMTFNS